MNNHNHHAPFPIPVVATQVGAGSHEDDGLAYMSMPSNMTVFHAPLLPEPEDMTHHPDALHTLHALVDMVAQTISGQSVAPMSLLHLSPEDLKLVNQVLGEGEVSATVQESSPSDRPYHPQTVNTDSIAPTRIDIQETAFVGVWRVLAFTDSVKTHDAIEVSAIPIVLRQTAQLDAQLPFSPAPLPPELLNVPSILEEIRAHSAEWTAGQEVHVINLTLLPLSEIDIAYIDDQIGTGRVVILSRGYGNCRIINTRTANVWRLVYYNSQDNVILNCIEITAVPEAACAAPADFDDTHERLIEVLTWLENE